MTQETINTAAPVLLGLLLIGALSCSEIEPTVEQVGSIRLLPIDPSLGTGFQDDELIQAVRWTVTRAQLNLDGQVLDLLAGEASCTYIDTMLGSPFVFESTSGADRCAGGIIIGESETPMEGTLEVTLAMDVFRLEPYPPLDPAGDEDEDGLLNADDLCPLIALVQPDPPPDPPLTQHQDDNDDGLADDCHVGDIFDPTLVSLDTDGDDVADTRDNCVDVFNSLQVDLALNDPPGFPALDGIGDDCEDRAQMAVVSASGNVSFEIAGAPDAFPSTVATVNYIVADFTNDLTMDCNWAAGTCTLDPTQVGICVQSDFTAALGGCFTPAP